MLKRLMLLLAFAPSVSVVFAQEDMTASGTVVDAAGETVIGASVKVTGKNTGAVTDMNGKFSIKGLKSGDRLEISYVGMKTQKIAARQDMKITMEEDDNSVLNEVVITAFGEQKRSAFTGSAAVMNADKIERKQVTNVLSALRGEAAGVQMTTGGSPTDAPTIRVRGFSSINADNDPLVIVDGSPFEGQWNDINPADIENVTVLKDAASAALYGARGANGIIMITTKKAKSGNATITFDAKWGGTSRIKRDYETIDNVGQYYETYYKALYNYYTNSKGYNPVDANIAANTTMAQKSAAEGGLGYMTMSVPDGEKLIGTNGRLNPNATMGNIISSNGKEYLITPDNWMNEASHVGYRQEYNFNANGGNDKGQYYASLGYLDNQGVAIGSEFERYTARMKANYQLKSWLKIGGNANFSRSNANYISTGSYNLFYMCQTIAPIYPAYIRDANGNILQGIAGRLYDYGNGENNPIGLTRPFMTGSNPIQEVTLNTYSSISNLYSIDGFADITPLDGLKITLKANVTDNPREATYGTNPYYGSSATAYNNGNIQQVKDETYSYNFQQLVNYRRSFGLHNTEFLLGHENFKRQYKYLSGSRSNVVSYLTNQTLSGAIDVHDTNSVTGSTTDGSNATGYNTEGYFFRTLYDYDSKYYGNFSIRRDGSSRFNPGKRWGTFYSFGGAWVMTEEEWLKDVSWLNSLKFKTSYGQVGNDAIGDFRYLDTYKIVNANGNAGLQVANVGDKNITWETVGNFNTGVEFELFGNRVTGSVEYFYRKTTDMLAKVYVPQSAGYTYTYHNIGDMVNRGFELDFNFGVLRTKDLTWNVNLNATFYKNKITKLADDLKNNKSYEPSGYANGDYFYGEGLPMYTMYIPKYAGVNEDGRSTWYTTSKNNDGVYETSITTDYAQATNYITDDPNPDVYGGFGTSLSWKGLDFNVSFAYSIGGKAYDYGYASLMTNPVSGSTGSAIHKDMLNAWCKENTSSDIPRWQYGDTNSSGISDRFLTDASWLTFSNINIGYSLKGGAVRKMGISKIRLYVTGENLYFWSARKGFDPRTSFNGTSNTNSYSPSRTISGGITVTF